MSTQATRLVSPLLRRVLAVNFVPLALLLAALLYLDQYQNGLLNAEVSALREQARIYAGALGESAVALNDPNNPKLITGLARPLLQRLTDPAPDASAKIYAPDGTLIADSRVREGNSGAVTTETLPPADDHSPLIVMVGKLYDQLFAIAPRSGSLPPPGDGSGDGTDDAGAEQSTLQQELRLGTVDGGHETAPFIRRTGDDRLLVTVAEPIERDRHTVGIVLLTRDAREVDRSLFSIRVSILGLFLLALILTVLLSSYLSFTITGPILYLAEAAKQMRHGAGRKDAVPGNLIGRGDEIGDLARTFATTAEDLWARMDAIEQFAADVAHEIKNPLSSIRSAIETLRRIEDPKHHPKLFAIIQNDVTRLDRLISDISDASRVDAEISRAAPSPLDVVKILTTLAEIADATRDDDDPVVTLDVPRAPLIVAALEGRLVQVLRNLIGNAQSFSPPEGKIMLRAKETGNMIEIAVEDEGPGIPEGNLEHVFDRFYSERPAGESFGKHSGLGLSISRQIIEGLQGRISAENRRDAAGEVRGARFVVRLPKIK